MSLATTIQYMYPAAIPLIDYEIRDEGAGAFIGFWNIEKLGREPTDAALVAASGAAALAAAKFGKLKDINEKCVKLMAQIRDGYPADEIHSWPKQETEARAYLADNTASVPLLTALAAARGIDLADLVQRVILKADQFAEASGLIIGARQKCEDALEAAKTVEEVEAVVWPE